MPTDWDQIVRQHGPGVFRAAWRVLANEADAEDVVQAVFLEANRLWRTRPAAEWVGMLRADGDAPGLDRLRMRRTHSDLEGRIAYATDDPVAEAIGRELAQRLGQALGELAPREAEVFSLRYFEDYSNERIAELLRITPSAVSTALHKVPDEAGDVTQPGQGRRLNNGRCRIPSKGMI